MAQKFLTPIDLTKNELQNARIQNLASAPGSPVDGQIYYDTTTNALMVYDADGAAWVSYIPLAQKAAASGVASLNASSLVVQNPANAQTTPAAAKIPLANGSNKIDNGWLNTGSGNALDADTLDGQHGTHYLARANHTGTQTASTISDFDTQVRTSRLDQMAAPNVDLSMASHKITNVTDPTSAQDAATKNYVDGVASGISHKDSVRAATTVNITRSAPQTIDGVSVIAGDRVLVKNQTAPAENGIFVVAAGAWTRATDMDVWSEVPSAFTFVEEGTGQADTSWVSTANAGGTLNTTSITWTQFGAPGSISASNQGTGVGVYDTQVGSDLQFRNVKAGSSKVTVTLVSKDIVVDVVPSALGTPTKYATSIGNNSNLSFVVNHALATTDVIVQVKEVGGGLAVVYADIVVTDANNISVSFTIAPTTNQYRVIVIG